MAERKELKRTRRKEIERSEEESKKETVVLNDENTALEESYQKAVELMAKETYSDYVAAVKELTKIKDYKDSKELIKKCQESISEIKYVTADALMNQNTISSFQKARGILLELKDYKDSFNLLGLCDQKIAIFTYNEALELMSEHTVEAYKVAITRLETIQEYNDAQDKIKECEEEIHKLENLEEKQSIEEIIDEKVQQASKKSKPWKIIIPIVVVVLVLVLGIGVFVLKSNSKSLDVKIVTVEEGQEVVLDPKSFVDTENSKGIDVDSLVLESDLTTDTSKYTYDKSTKTVVSKDMNYLAAGEYVIKIMSSDKKMISTTTLVVKDSTGPTFTKTTDPIDYYAGQDPINYNDYFEATDNNGVTLTYDESAIDYNTDGSYTLTVTATDNYNNATTITATVNVSGNSYYYDYSDYTYDDSSYDTSQEETYTEDYTDYE